MLRITEINEQTFRKNFQKKGVRMLDFFKYHNHKKNPRKYRFVSMRKLCVCITDGKLLLIVLYNFYLTNNQLLSNTK